MMTLLRQKVLEAEENQAQVTSEVLAFRAKAEAEDLEWTEAEWIAERKVLRATQMLAEAEQGAFEEALKEGAP